MGDFKQNQFFVSIAKAAISLTGFFSLKEVVLFDLLVEQSLFGCVYVASSRFALEVESNIQNKL